jgi:hypothetical protein
MTRWNILLCILLLATSVVLLGAGSQPQTDANKSQANQTSAAAPDFDVQGIGFTMCQCTAYACPCRKGGSPTHGSCDAADFAFIQKGHIGNVKMDGFKSVIVGDLIDKDHSKTKAVVYFDEKTTPEQRKAFLSMASFMFGEGMPIAIGPPRMMPIQFKESADKTTYEVNIPGILEEKAVLKRDANGKPVNTVPAVDQWGNTIHYADATVFKYDDKESGQKWDLSGRQSNLKFFHTTKKMYDNHELLAQHAGTDGKWTDEQQAMINKMGMKPE